MINFRFDCFVHYGIKKEFGYKKLLDRISDTEDAKESLIYSYGRSFNGFAAKLSDEEVETFSGIWPESESFSDKGFGPPPAKWKELAKLTTTLPATTGRKVKGANYFGLAEGLARGGVPEARIAVYKSCWLGAGCYAADILAAFDDAIADGIDLISVSIGKPTVQYWEEPVAIGSFHAMKHGILTSASSGNYGPERAVIQNYLPWSLTVAASSIDRKFMSHLVLGNGQTFMGSVVNAFELNGTPFPLIWGGDATNFSGNYISPTSKYCIPGALNMNKVEGKIVLCKDRSDGSGAFMANGAGVIMPSQPFDNFALPFPLPTTIISTKDISKVLEYIRSSNEEIQDITAPYAASFSSRGPNPITPDILKPDHTAPGVNILAAWTPLAPASVYKEYTRSTKYYIDSGTLMACPHASGVAAYVKATHPSWSPAAIKSALMTIDYIDFLCKQGYNTSTIRLVTGEQSVRKSTKAGRGWDINYPSLSLAIEDGQKISGIFTRTVTNVGSPNSTYHAKIDKPDSLNITVEPSVLSFSAVGDKKIFIVNVKGKHITQVPIVSGSISWIDGVHVGEIEAILPRCGIGAMNVV
ncbi:hypothetical protein SO802_023541 [Lithocarpus litseifolius]|uniref:Cucumisin n=1 Tax=Lithocarpus litseifolius TaxID=425828 RepID=A0AAW2C807_9ROSI